MIFPPRNMVAVETGVSGMIALERDVNITLRFRYLSPVNDIQSDFFSGPLYFLAAEKKLGDQWKVGLTTAMPFSRRFTYNGLETQGDQFHQRTTGQINMSRLPIWLTLNYSFKKGKSVQKEKKKVSNGLHINKRGSDNKLTSLFQNQTLYPCFCLRLTFENLIGDRLLLE